jgi:hypothetical protein
MQILKFNWQQINLLSHHNTFLFGTWDLTLNQNLTVYANGLLFLAITTEYQHLCNISDLKSKKLASTRCNYNNWLIILNELPGLPGQPTETMRLD